MIAVLLALLTALIPILLTRLSTAVAIVLALLLVLPTVRLTLLTALVPVFLALLPALIGALLILLTTGLSLRLILTALTLYRRFLAACYAAAPTFRSRILRSKTRWVSAMNGGVEVLVVYDKQCPACDYYCNIVRIRESVGRLVLVDARDGGPIMEEITARGLDIDQGMVVKVGKELYYGPGAIHALALMGTNKGLFNRLAYWSFRSRAASRILYPILKACRNLLLKVLGKSMINNLGVSGNETF